MRWKLLILVLCSCYLSGCVVEKTSYQQNLIPIKCAIEVPRPPELNKEKTLQSLRDNYVKILIYTEELERSLHFCIRGENSAGL